jgi:hypothetical protein
MSTRGVRQSVEQDLLVRGDTRSHQPWAISRVKGTMPSRSATSHWMSAPASEVRCSTRDSIRRDPLNSTENGVTSFTHDAPPGACSTARRERCRTTRSVMRVNSFHRLTVNRTGPGVRQTSTWHRGAAVNSGPTAALEGSQGRDATVYPVTPGQRTERARKRTRLTDRATNRWKNPLFSFFPWTSEVQWQHD